MRNTSKHTKAEESRWQTQRQNRKILFRDGQVQKRAESSIVPARFAVNVTRILFTSNVPGLFRGKIVESLLDLSRGIVHVRLQEDAFYHAPGYSR